MIEIESINATMVIDSPLVNSKSVPCLINLSGIALASPSTALSTLVVALRTEVRRIECENEGRKGRHDEIIVARIINL